MMKSALLLALALAFVSLLAPHARAQEVSPDEVIKVNTDLVVLDAQVFVKKNRKVVTDLKREDFALTEDGAPREISYFSRDELPLSVVLLLDVSRSVRPIIERISAGAVAATKQLKPEDEIAVMVFAERTEVVQDFTRDRRLVAQKIGEAARAEVGNGTMLTPGLSEAARETLKSANPASRRVVIVVTDNIAVVGGKNEVRRATDDLIEAGAVVYGLIVRGSFGKTINVLSFGQIHAVETFSEPTGGEVFGAAKSEVDEKLGEMFARLRTRYSLGFKTTNTTDDGRLRKLKLELTPQAATRYDKPSVLTKRGYYFRPHVAPSPPASAPPPPPVS